MPQWFRSFAGHMWGIARTSLIATAATTPFAIYHFQSLSLYGFAANMAAIPVTSFWIMPSIIFAYLTAPFGCDGIFIDAAGAGVALTIRIATTVAGWPHSIFYWPAMPGWVLIVIVLGGLWLCIWERRWRYLGLLPVLLGMLYPFYTPQPDFFVSPDGREWAARMDDGRLAVSNLDHDKFAVTQWQQRLGNVPLIDVLELPDNPQMRCDKAGCVYRKGPHIVAMPIAEPATLEDCTHADIVIAPFAIHDCVAPHLIDAQALQKGGAYTIYFTAKTTGIDSARTSPGARPWSVGWPHKKPQNQD